MDRRRARERTIQAIIRLCHAGLDLTTFKGEAINRVRTLIPFDASCLATADPATLLFTGFTADELLATVSAQVLVNEFLEDDVNTFRALAHSRMPVGTLSAATQHTLTQSARYRTLLADLTLADELRAALVVGGACWGFLSLHREAASPHFTPTEAALLAQLTPHLAYGLRTALLRRAVTAPTGLETPGVVLLAEDLAVVATTPAADSWLAELGPEQWPRGWALPVAVYGVAARLVALERGGMAQGARLPQARLRTASGQWLVLHATRLVGLARRDQIAVIIEVARSVAIAPLIVQAYGLSPREAEIVQWVAGGRSTAEIAAQLHIASSTVQDHLKAIFTKVGVHSRGELLVQLFAAHYQPRIEAGTPPDTDGWFS
jgi:DNA-binding CsgD family transcriptional regulator